ncbi:hypothetical protein J4045_02475, partial [Klebsiella aerogenes]
IMHIID